MFSHDFYRNYPGTPQNTSIEDILSLPQSEAPPPPKTLLIPVYSEGNIEIIAPYISDGE